MLYIVFNPATGLGYDVVNLAPERVEELRQSGEAFEPYDFERHASFWPGDKRGDDGGFATPPLSDVHRETAHNVLDDAHVDAKSEILKKAMLADDQRAAKVLSDAQIAALASRKKQAHAEVDAAQTIHDLPPEARAGIGIPMKWRVCPIEISKAVGEAMSGLVGISRSAPVAEPKQEAGGDT